MYSSERANMFGENQARQIQEQTYNNKVMNQIWRNLNSSSKKTDPVPQSLRANYSSLNFSRVANASSSKDKDRNKELGYHIHHKYNTNENYGSRGNLLRRESEENRFLK